MLLSIVLPAYNEEHRIGAVLTQLIEYRSGCDHQLEILVVDDGSTDATAAVAQSYAHELPELRVIRLPSNRGKGRAVAVGMTEAKGAYRAFFDADGATPIPEVDKLLATAQSNPRTVAIGSIRAPGDAVVQRQPLHRTVAGRVGNALIRAAVLPGIADSQRGCKLFPAELADVVFAAQETDGWGFDIEVLALCLALRYDIVEVPVDWSHIDGGQVGAGAYVSTFTEVMRIRRMMRTGSHKIDSLVRDSQTSPVAALQRKAV